MGKLLKIFLGFLTFVAIVIAAAFYFTSGIANKADDFFKAVTKHEYDSAYSMLSEEFKKNTNKQELIAFLEQNNLTQVKETSWNSREIKNGQGTVKGKVTSETGGTVPLTINFIKGKNDWMIYSITKPGSGIRNKNNDTNEQTARNIPNNDELIKLVQESNNVFAGSIAKKDMNEFYNYSSKLWRDDTTAEELARVFNSFYQFDDKLFVLNKHIPAFTQKPFINENSFLQVTGEYSQLKPKIITFTHKYIKEGLEWKLVGFKMNIN